jgi:hypothetical protein
MTLVLLTGIVAVLAKVKCATVVIEYGWGSMREAGVLQCDTATASTWRRSELATAAKRSSNTCRVLRWIMPAVVGSVVRYRVEERR